MDNLDQIVMTKKYELEKLIDETGGLENNAVLKKSEELDRLIVSFMLHKLRNAFVLENK